MEIQVWDSNKKNWTVLFKKTNRYVLASTRYKKRSSIYRIGGAIHDKHFVAIMNSNNEDSLSFLSRKIANES